ncbi:MAG: Crp/Fnr family transcriptional regulator, partial [Azospirillum sp.]|nr:Crp/Fnr family transcriptional regulator [Azospirillum sp.]
MHSLYRSARIPTAPLHPSPTPRARPGPHADRPSLSPTYNVLHDGIVFWEGDQGSGCVRLQKGVLRAVRFSEDGTRQILGFVRAPATLCLGADRTWPCTLEAVNDCRIAKDHESAIACAVDRPFETIFADMALVLLAVISRKSVVARFAWFIAELHRAEGKETIDFGYPRADIADYLGTRIETVCRALARFREDGMIEQLPDRRLRITDPDRLQEVARDRPGGIDIPELR